MSKRRKMISNENTFFHYTLIHRPGSLRPSTLARNTHSQHHGQPDGLVQNTTCLQCAGICSWITLQIAASNVNSQCCLKKKKNKEQKKAWLTALPFKTKLWICVWEINCFFPKYVISGQNQTIPAQAENKRGVLYLKFKWKPMTGNTSTWGLQCLKLQLPARTVIVSFTTS